MIHHKVVQGSAEWHALRVGIPTASEFSRIITPAKWEPTKGETRRKYAIELITEQMLGRALDPVTTAAMASGHEWEPRARSAYKMLHGCDVKISGFWTDDAMTYGASPDALVGEDGLLEIKCPQKPELHVANMLHPELFRAEHFVQTQSQLFVTGRTWTDLVSYFQGLPDVTVRIQVHPDFQAKLKTALSEFLEIVEGYRTIAITKGWLAASSQTTERPEKAPNIMGITQEDIEDYIASKFPKEPKND